MNKKNQFSHRSSFSIHCSKRGFTLIELLVVIAILSLLAALALSNMGAGRARARDARRKSDLRQIKAALMMYHNDFNTFPSVSSSYTEQLSGCNPATDFPWGSEFVCVSMTYMKILPDDPLNDQNSSYTYHYDFDSASPHDFCLWAPMENVSDPDAATSISRCSDCGLSGSYYVVCAD